jgi:hypothetical protein
LDISISALALQELLDQDDPPIALLNAGELPYGSLVLSQPTFKTACLFSIAWSHLHLTP